MPSHTHRLPKRGLVLRAEGWIPMTDPLGSEICSAAADAFAKSRNRIWPMYGPLMLLMLPLFWLEVQTQTILRLDRGLTWI